MSTNKTSATNQVKTACGASSTTAYVKPASKLQAAYALGKLRPFLSAAQLSIFDEMRFSEERQFFFDKAVELAETTETMPTTYQTDGQGDQAVAFLHYFTSDCDWYITERDESFEQLQAFGLACIWEEEVGYISIQELIEAGAELDLYWTPKTLGQVKAERQMQDVNSVCHPMHY